jgi:hypothetical protein
MRDPGFIAHLTQAILHPAIGQGFGGGAIKQRGVGGERGSGGQIARERLLGGHLCYQTMTTKAEIQNEKITCAIHGESDVTFVCHHLVQGQGVGFFYSDEEFLRPDAWCLECERFLTEHGGEWNDETEAFATVTVICANCYDGVRQRNEMPFKRIRPQGHPNLEEDGWELDNAAIKHLRHPETFMIPLHDDVRGLKVGDVAKLLFLFMGQNDPIDCERMWVTITQIENSDYRGRLESEPVRLRKLKLGMEIQFRQEHIASILYPATRQKPATPTQGSPKFKSSSWKDNVAYY